MYFSSLGLISTFPIPNLNFVIPSTYILMHNLQLNFHWVHIKSDTPFNDTISSIDWKATLPPCPIMIDGFTEFIDTMTDEQFIPGLTCKPLPVCSEEDNKTDLRGDHHIPG